MIQRLFIILCLFAAPAAARAGAIAEIGGAMSWEKQTDGLNYRTNAPWTARAGWAFYDFDALLEFATFSRSDAEPNGRIDFAERQLTLWARFPFRVPYIVKPYVGAGIGARQEETTEVFLGSTDSTRGRPRWMGAIAGGAMLTIWGGLVGELEARLTDSPGYSPNPQISAWTAVGYRF